MVRQDTNNLPPVTEEAKIEKQEKPQVTAKKPDLKTGVLFAGAMAGIGSIWGR